MIVGVEELHHAAPAGQRTDLVLPEQIAAKANDGGVFLGQVRDAAVELNCVDRVLLHSCVLCGQLVRAPPVLLVELARRD